MLEQAQEAGLFFDDLHGYLKTKFNYKRKMGNLSPLNNNTISINRNRVSMYLRYKPSNAVNRENMLVIARIEFEEQRKGHGTDFLKFLCKFSGKYKIQNIALEQTNVSSSSFARKHGFKELLKDYWVVSISDLLINLNLE
ncbi:hypothetical protein N473_26160 [Pseudoalteromonas luteoviolacea CPMOR-1]|uniref:N-acetyltransferase domain-containing protein n=1 Tax=Pseudoalteromonas luteoviolacea CPMOR-1 TaxID=1365248 RepID=A0A167I546_9GAMM|nr:hypothetical protein [Pseudoalteromonas luteoviolacea]KZN58904.1 hypothetical protein N473_26160 [Pseudoalteromonas luteoviolacea CPMOR-1]